MGLFKAALMGRQKVPLPKTCHIYPTMIELGTVVPYLNKTQRYMNHVTNPLSCSNVSIFHWKSANFAISKNTDIDCNIDIDFDLDIDF